MLTIEWDQIDQAEWHSLYRQVPRPTLEQCWTYGEAAAADRKGQVRRASIKNGRQTVALAQVLTKPVGPFLTWVQLTRGPLWLQDISDKTEAWQLIRRSFRLSRREVFVWLPEAAADPSSVESMRKCGKRQMVTGYSTVWIDLKPEVTALRSGLHGKWRNALTKAEKAGLRLETSNTGRPLDWLLDRYRSQRRKNRFGGATPEMLAHFAQSLHPRQDIVVLRAFFKKEPVTGALFVRHGSSATYVAGWSDVEGRIFNAQHYLLWQAMLHLKKLDVDWLDLGGVNGSKAPGIARFKMGLGGQVETLAGTFI